MITTMLNVTVRIQVATLRIRAQLVVGDWVLKTRYAETGPTEDLSESALTYQKDLLIRELFA